MRILKNLRLPRKIIRQNLNKVLPLLHFAGEARQCRHCLVERQCAKVSVAPEISNKMHKSGFFKVSSSDRWFSEFPILFGAQLYSWYRSKILFAICQTFVTIDSNFHFAQDRKKTPLNQQIPSLQPFFTFLAAYLRALPPQKKKQHCGIFTTILQMLQLDRGKHCRTTRIFTWQGGGKI